MAPKATVLREGQDLPVLWSLWDAVQGLVTLAFPRNKMKAGLPLILLPGLGSLHTVEGPRGLFLPSLKPCCCQQWAQQLYCGETGTKLSHGLCHFLRNQLENKKGEKKKPKKKKSNKKGEQRAGEPDSNQGPPPPHSTHRNRLQESTEV